MFDIGSKVKLIGSDNEMVVSAVDGNVHNCRWMDSFNKLQSANFDIKELQSSAPKPSGFPFMFVTGRTRR